MKIFNALSPDFVFYIVPKRAQQILRDIQRLDLVEKKVKSISEKHKLKQLLPENMC